MPNYTREGKLLDPMTDEDFKSGMETGKFLKPKHRAFCVLLYYSAVRKQEALRTVKEQFQLTRSAVFFDVKKRLKRGKITPPLKLPLKAPFMEELKEAIEQTKPGEKVFPYCDKTGYNIVRRVFHYPHFFRLNRITQFFLDGWSIAEVKSWTGLTLSALNFYVGQVDISRMGDSLAKKKGEVKL